jgi:alpha-L-rhamnosidase
MRFWVGAISCLWLSQVGSAALGRVEGPRANGLRVEYLKGPQGIDAVRPRLTWIMNSPKRGDFQSGYEVRVAQSEANLVRDQDIFWDSGKVDTGAFGVSYGGPPMRLGLACYWKVRLWDKRGKVGPWSAVGFWSMGLLDRADWQAQWISSPILADPANRPRTPLKCYRSELSSNPNRAKWIVLDLGCRRAFDSIGLGPARPHDLTFDIGTVQFPRRFRLEASDDPNFQGAKVLFETTEADYPEPRVNECRFTFPETTARYVRLYVTRLGVWDARDFGIFLGQFSVYSGTQDIAIGANVTPTDSIETSQWSKNYLVSGHPQVEFCPFPKTLEPNVPGAFSPSRVTLLRRDFEVPGAIQRATLYGTARGFYEARINGHKVGEDLLSPGFTDFHIKNVYEAYDVTDLLHSGANTVGALLGYGWYAGHMNLGGNAYLYGYFPQFAAQLEIELKDGRQMTVATDKEWRTTLDSGLRWSDILDGEAHDFRMDPPEWDQPRFDGSKWPSAWSQPLGPEKLVAQRDPSVRVIRTMKPISESKLRPGVWVFDLGQEVTGWVKIRTSGPAGTHVCVTHAEAIQKDGELDRASLWGTPQQDDYFLDGKGMRTLEPHFTYHGFRYFEISGLALPPVQGSVVAMVVHTDVAEVGKFECSNMLFNRLMKASRWTQRNLMFDVPAGCAARSERLAWTGDIRPCVQTALFNFDSAAFFEKYAADLRDDQTVDGRFTDICPHAHLTGTDICVGSPGWADAGVSLPWDVLVNEGDVNLLKDHFTAAKRWVDYVHGQNPGLIWERSRGMDWGDWMSAGPATPQELGATAFFAHSTDLVARMARALGRSEDYATYKALFLQIKTAFNLRYVSPDGVIRAPVEEHRADLTAKVRSLVKNGRLDFEVGNGALGIDPAPGEIKELKLRYLYGGVTRYIAVLENQPVQLRLSALLSAVYQAEAVPRVNDAQGSYALALHFGLIDEPMRARVVRHLLAAIRRDGGHPSTGFWSSVEMMLALSDSGQNLEASRMVNLTTEPSWGYMLQSGGTTFWEAFDADKRTLSLNHWTHSACGEWLWKDVAGLSPDPDFPGYTRFVVHPRPTPEVSWCKAEYRSVRGPIKISWKVSSHRFTLDLKVPVGSVATMYLQASMGTVFEGGRRVLSTKGVKYVGRDGDSAIYEVASGEYHFSALGPRNVSLRGR